MRRRAKFAPETMTEKQLHDRVKITLAQAQEVLEFYHQDSAALVLVREAAQCAHELRMRGTQLRLYG